jgi:ubiquinone biosynthesis protein
MSSQFADSRTLHSHSPHPITLICRALRIGGAATYYLATGGLAACAIALCKSRAQGKRFFARRFVLLLQKLGPTFIKVGQVLGTRRDVLPRVLCDELVLLQDAVAALSPAQAQMTLKDVYGQHLADLFERIDDYHVASGSIACVYRARMRNGREVAIKLQRPGIQSVMSADLTIITNIGTALARLRVFCGIPVQEVLEHLCAAVYAQLDFAREGESLKRLHDNLAAVPRLWVPRLDEDLSRDRALVMEFIPGLDLETARQCSPAVRKKFGASLLAAVYRMIFIDGFVHCDLHPGNLYFTKSGQVVILDAGFSMRLPERIRRLFGEFFLNMSLGRGKRCAEIVIESAAGQSPDADLEGFTVHLANLVERSSRLAAKDFSLIAFATELFDLQRRFGLQAATEMIFPLLSLLVIEGTVRDLDPDVDFQKAAEPILTRGVFGARAG